MATRKESRNSRQHPVNGKTLRAAVAWVVDAKIFAHLKFHGNTKWQAVDLILLAIIWVWCDDQTLTGAFAEARSWSQQVLGRVAVKSYQGFLKALVTWTAKMLPLIRERLQSRMQQHGGKHWRVGLWLALAVDGSRISVPRTKDNEKAFCAPNYGQSRTAKSRRKKKRKEKEKRRRLKKKKMQPVKPQIWLTLMWHMGLQMPWSWRSGPSYSSEREHFQSLLKEEKFPENTLFCCDAGFTGYELWKQIIDARQSFLIRVGANVKLLRNLGYVEEKPDLVYFWPNRAAREKQPPLVLRLLALQVGRCKMWLLTNVLDEKDLSNGDAVRLYQLRWGVELQFRAIKQTFGRRKLRSCTPERAVVELDWSLLGLWMVQLFAVKEQVEIGKVPEHCSVGLAIRVVRSMIQRRSDHPESSFAEEMQSATKDSYKRKAKKMARYRPDYKDKPAAGQPRVLKATQKQKDLLKRLSKKAA
jgi:hypothetical protein